MNSLQNVAEAVNHSSNAVVREMEASIKNNDNESQKCSTEEQNQGNIAQHQIGSQCILQYFRRAERKTIEVQNTRDLGRNLGSGGYAINSYHKYIIPQVIGNKHKFQLKTNVSETFEIMKPRPLTIISMTCR